MILKFLNCQKTFGQLFFDKICEIILPQNNRKSVSFS